jgi:hypothetical protein
VLAIHPAANLFPRMSDQELDELGADIKKNGLQQRVVILASVDCDRLLDGRNRLDAMERVGVPFNVGDPKLVRQVWNVDPIDYVIGANIHRRHLTSKQKRELMGKLLKLDPGKSDRQIAKTTGASPTTVGTVRAAMEATGDVSRLDTRTDSKGRQQPARKPEPEPIDLEDAIAAVDAATDPASFEVGADFKDLLLKAPGWTGAIVGTQTEVDAAIECLRDDGAPHWLMVAPRERVVVDHRVVHWLLITSPASPTIVHIEWAIILWDAATKARCPVWVSERLTGKSHPQRPGMTWPRELPIPRELPALRELDLHTAIRSLIDASNRLDDFNNGLPPDVEYTPEDLNRIIVRLDDLRRKIVAKHAEPLADPGPMPEFLRRGGV